ncbi:MAG TPA: thiamine-phosphate kinase [Stellaceae bacterium]|nr:thiamine-phosphate kinase [Stellaceae bacterium]
MPPKISTPSSAARSTAPLSGEFALIARYFAPLAAGFPGADGLRDDVAVIAPAAGCELVLKSDAIVAGVDFPPEEAADLVARKALRVNLSDLAAKGAVPRAYLLDLILPETIGDDWIALFAAGLAQDQREYGVHLIGGDMSSTPGPVTIAVMAMGEAPAGRIVRRGGAKAGDQVFVSGTLGDAALGLGVLQGRLPAPDEAAAAFLLDRYRLPQPRVALGPRLIGLASATIDVSDGLVADLRHICEAAGLAATVEAPALPLSMAARAMIAADPGLLSAPLGGGDDYEILFTAPPQAAAAIAALSHALGLPITAIGRMMRPAAAGPRVTVVDGARRPIELGSEGWTHFGRSG